MHYYQKESTGYGFVASATVPCSNGNHCTLTRNYISEDGTKSISFSYDDQEYKFCLIENSTISFRQSIPFTNPLSNSKPVKGDQLFLISSTSLQLYQFNSNT